MKTSTFYIKIISLGLTIISLNIFLKTFIQLPDFTFGLLMGMGLGIEIYAALMIVKLRKSKTS